MGGKKKRRPLIVPTCADLEVSTVAVLVKSARHSGSAICPPQVRTSLERLAADIERCAETSGDLLDVAAETIRLIHRYQLFDGPERLAFIVNVVNEFLEDNDAILDGHDYELTRLNNSSFAQPERKPELASLLRALILDSSDHKDWRPPAQEQRERRVLVLADADASDESAYEAARDDAITVCAAVSAATWVVDCPFLASSVESQETDVRNQILDAMDAADAVIVILGGTTTWVLAGAVPRQVPLLVASRDSVRPWAIPADVFEFFDSSSRLTELTEHLIAKAHNTIGIHGADEVSSAEANQLAAEVRAARIAGTFRVPPGLTARRIDHLLSSPRTWANSRTWERRRIMDGLGASDAAIAVVTQEDELVNREGQLELDLGLGVDSDAIRRHVEFDASALTMAELTAQLAGLDFDWESTEWLSGDELQALRDASRGWPEARASVMHEWGNAVRALEYRRTSGRDRQPVRLRKTNLNHMLDWNRHHRTIFGVEETDE